jgi:hypothetical protein
MSGARASQVSATDGLHSAAVRHEVLRDRSSEREAVVVARRDIAGVSSRALLIH